MNTQTPGLQKLFIKAAKAGDVAALRLLLGEDASLVNVKDTDGSTPLHCAAWKGHTDAAALLMEFGADVHARNNNDHWGDTPLHATAHGNRRAVAELLIAKGADIHAKNASDNTPLKETEAHCATAVATLLKKHGATH